MTSTRPTNDTPQTAGTAVNLPPPVSLPPVPQLSIGRSDRAPVDRMVRDLGLRSFPGAAPLAAPAVGAQAPAGTVPASAVIVADKGDLSLEDIANGVLTPKVAATQSQILPALEAKAKLEATLKALQEKLAVARKNEQSLRDTIARDARAVHGAEDELALIDRDSGSLAVKARELQARLEGATARRGAAIPGTPDAFAATGELRDLETVRLQIIRVARDLSAARTQKQSFIDQTTMRSKAAEALLSNNQPLLIAVEGQIKDARAMLESQQAQDVMINSSEAMTSIREKLQEMLLLLDGEHLADFQSIMANQAQRDVQIRMRDQQHTQEASRLIKSVTQKVDAQNDDAFLALCATPLDDTVKVTSELRSNVARDALARYGLAPPTQTEAENQNDGK